ncbi:MAG: hypothetical protein ACJZ4Z_00180 [Candidatus Thalassarchaeaceae archaeon]
MGAGSWSGHERRTGYSPEGALGIVSD